MTKHPLRGNVTKRTKPVNFYLSSKILYSEHGPSGTIPDVVVVLSTNYKNKDDNINTL